MQKSETYYRLALSLVEGIGPKLGRALLSHFHSAEQIFKASPKDLAGLSGFQAHRIKALKDEKHFRMADEEMNFIQKNNIELLRFESEAYPKILKDCNDAPLILFKKGQDVLNQDKAVAIVGTRHLSEYGHSICEKIVSEFSKIEGVVIVSGLAQGIDAVAHQTAIKNNIPTVGVLAHGFSNIYPREHRSLSEKMLNDGALLTEFPFLTKPDKPNFPVRNRIVAGMTKVTVVIETNIKGGSLITTNLASGYNREVAAVPGRVGDTRSQGCLNLIKNNQAALVTSAEDILELMGWEQAHQKTPKARQLSLILAPAAQKIWDYLSGVEKAHSDSIQMETDLPVGELATTLLEMEMEGLVKTLPGKMYRLK